MIMFYHVFRYIKKAVFGSFCIRARFLCSVYLSLVLYIESACGIISRKNLVAEDAQPDTGDTSPDYITHARHAHIVDQWR